MRTNNLYKLISLLAIFSILLPVSFGQEKQSGKALQKSLKRKLRIEDVKSYRTMNRLNDKPLEMDKASGILCGRSFIRPYVHYAPGVVYYINDITQKGLSNFKEKKNFRLAQLSLKRNMKTKLKIV